MSAHLRSALGYNRSQVLFASAEEAVWACGNTLVLRNLTLGSQRILRGTSYGIGCFTVNRQQGLLALAEKGPNPAIRIYTVADLKCVATVSPSTQLGYTALAFSADGKRLAVCTDEPDLILTVHEWRQSQVVVQATLPKPVHSISFHPLNADQLCSTGSGQLHIWTIEKLWDKYDMVSKMVDLESVEPTCHAYFPGGVYVGGTAGELLAIDPLAALGTSPTSAPAATPLPAAAGSAPPTAAAGAAPPPAGATQAPAGDAAAAAEAQPRPCIMLTTQATEGGGAVTGISMNRDLVAVACSEPVVRCFTHATPGFTQRPGIPTTHQPFELRAQALYGTTPLLSVDYGGAEFTQVLVGTAEGTVYLSDIEPGSGEVATNVLCEAHTGAVAAMRTHPTLRGHVVSCGADGTLRVWDTEAGSCVSRRTFSSAQTAMGCCPGRPLLALGSETGVVRLVSLAPDAARPLQIVFRKRLHTAAVQDIVFSDTGEWMATAGKDRNLCFTLLHEQDAPVVLGHISCPSPVLNLVWPRAPDADEPCVLATLASGGVMCCTVPIELSASGRPTNSPDMQLSNRDVNIKIVKLESPLLHVVGVAGHKYGELVGLGADKQLHKVMLPAEGQSWAGIKGRATKSSIKAQAHAAPEGAIDISPSGRLLVTASADGHLATHGLDLGTHSHTDEGGAPALHDVVSGGASAVAFDLSGRWLLSAGPDGSMFMFETAGASHLSMATPASGAVPVAAPLDLDALDEPSEVTEAEQHRKRLAETKSVSVGHHSNQAIQERLGELRRQLLECMERNEAADEIDKIERTDLIIDQGLVSELKAGAATRVSVLREQIHKEHLHLECVAARIKAACWDAMDERKGEAVTGMRSGVEVTNFPLKHQDDRVLRKVRMLRRMELAEERRESRSTSAMTAAVSQPLHDATADTPSGPGRSGGFPPPEDADHDEHREDGAAGEPVDALLYDDLNLHGRLRKTSQLHFFCHQAWQIKTAFNAEFDAVVKLKKAEADKVHDLNARLDETHRDLVKLGAPLHSEDRFVPPFPEDMAHILKVKDEEVKVDRVLTEAERAAADAARKAEEGGTGGQRGEAGLAERALRQMMGGTLASRDEEADPFALEKPAWMDGNPKLFSEEQLRELKEFQAREKAMQEEKAKRIAALEAELRGLRALVDEALQRFDDALSGLLAKKLKAKADITALESRCVALAINVDRCESASDSNEQAVYQKFSKATENKNLVSADLSEKRILLSSLETQTAEIVAEDKQLNHNFKREFIEAEPFYNKLLHMYRFRAANQDDEIVHRALTSTNSKIQRSMSIGSQHSHPIGVAPSALVPGSLAAKEMLMQDLALNTLEAFPLLPQHRLAEDPKDEPEMLEETYRPDGLDTEWWYQFVQYRAHKVHNENKQRTFTSQIALLQKEVAKLEAEETRLADETRSLMEAAAHLRKERQLALHDTDLQLRLKAGQVESEPPELVSSDLSVARFVHRSIVEGLNEAVHVRGGKKMEILTAIKDFKKGIYQLEWEQKKCDMMVEDLREKTRELQMFHVTRDLQAVFNEGEERGQANESANLEALSRQRETLHKKVVAEKQKVLRKIQRNVDLKQAQNAEVSAHLVTLERVLAEQERLRQSMQSIEDQTGRRMRSLVTHKKLKEIATAQQVEMRTLAAELDKMRMRTYPTFVEPTIASLPPDTKNSLWK